MNNKKQIRKNFRDSVFKRDNYKCRICGDNATDAHHICDRSLIINGGYVLSNGISLCNNCHLKVEQFHITGGVSWENQMHPDDLYKMIGSSKEKAFTDAEKLN